MWLKVIIGIGIFVGVVTICLALFAWWEIWKGHENWRRALEEARAAGEPTEFSQIIPPPAPDDQNFAAIPLFKPLYDYVPKVTGEGIPDDVWHDQAAKDRLDDLKLPVHSHNASWQTGSSTDLRAWQQDLTQAKPGAEKPPQWQQDWLRGLTPEVRDAAPGATILNALTAFDPYLEALREAAKRPRSRFPVHYDENFSMALPHLQVLQNFSSIVQLRALAELSLGKTEEALKDLSLGHNLAEAPREESLLISQLVRIGIYELLMQPLWEGLARRQWDDTQLASLDVALQRPDFIRSFQHTMWNERIGMARVMDDAKAHPSLFIAMFSPFSSRSTTGFLGQLGTRLFVAEWLDFNKATLFREEGEAAQTVDPAAHRVFPAKANLLFDGVKEDHDIHPYDPRTMLVSITLPAFSGVMQCSARVQEHIDLARVAIALERYRLAHGAFPSALAELSPVYMAAVPNDVVNGQPLHYSPNSGGGGFTLYSVGWNGSDEGGKQAFEKDNPSRIDWKNGDWPWPKYPSYTPAAEKR